MRKQIVRAALLLLLGMLSLYALVCLVGIAGVLVLWLNEAMG